MREIARHLLAGIVVGGLVAWATDPESLTAQETTAAIRGLIAAADSAVIDDAEVEAVNHATGFITRVMAHRGRFFVPGLAVGGPYTVTVRRIGYAPATHRNLFLSLRETVRLEFRLEPAAIELGEVEVVAEREAHRGVRSGVGTVVSDSFLRRLPSLHRDLYDFVKLSPYVTSRPGSIQGAGIRFNNFQIDGATAQALNGRAPAGNAPGRPISLEAVKEYEVVLAPYDVAEGDFAGVLVNGVTESGGNEFHGSIFGYLRNQMLARDVPLLRDSPYDNEQYGFSFSGPIVRNRVNFFVSADLERHTFPAPGPYAGQRKTSASPVLADTADITRFGRILRDEYGLEAGLAGPVTNSNPLANLFGRVDLAIPRWNGRLILRHSFGTGGFDQLVRDVDPFALSSLNVYQHSRTNVTVAQLFTSSRRGSSNEIRAEHYEGPNWFDPVVQQPLVSVAVPRVDGAGTLDIQAGSPASPFWFHQSNNELTDNLTLLLGAHRLTLGTKLETYSDTRRLVESSYGSWRFLSLDSLARGEADSFAVGKDFGGGTATVSGSEVAVWVGDEWQVTDRFLLRAGARGELPMVSGHPPYSPAVDSALGIRTDRMPARRILVSPRIGFDWDIAKGGRTRLRGGTGVFVARPPFAYWVEAFSRYGIGVRTLRCTTAPNSVGPPPPFSPYATSPPQACANGAGFNQTPGGDVALVAPNLTYPRVLRASLAIDQQLPWGVVATLEGLYTKGMRDLFFVNRGLKGPQGSDRHGRILYGTFDSDGNPLPTFRSDRFPNAFEAGSQSHSRSYEVSFQLAKPFSNGLEASASYSWSRVRDAQTPQGPLSAGATRSHVFSGFQEDRIGTTSDFDQPHRVVLAATYSAPWTMWHTDVSIIYSGSSGGPFTYLAGDLNADGAGNDPIYVPRTAFDTSEIRFAGTPAEIANQQRAFNQLITTTPCLASQRGRIMARNSCRNPWYGSLDLSIRQGLRGPYDHDVTLELQVFNFLNLLNSDWGAVRTTNTLLSQVGWAPTGTGPPEPVFAFDVKTPPFNTDNPSSYYQIQLALRYSF